MMIQFQGMQSNHYATLIAFYAFLLISRRTQIIGNGTAQDTTNFCD